MSLYYRNKGVIAKSCCLEMVDREFVKSALMKVNKAKGTGLDEIPARFVRDAAD